MSTLNQSFQFFLPKNHGKSRVALGAIGLTVFLSLASIGVGVDAQSRRTSYGLGLPKTATTGGATRGELPLAIVLAPRDGGRTLSARPTFYWFVSSASSNARKPFKITFYLRESPDIAAKYVFKGEGKSTTQGFYKFTLPASAPALEVGKVQRWQVRLELRENDERVNTDRANIDRRVNNEQFNLNALVKLTEAPAEVQKGLNGAKTELDKARVYAQYGYWYDALHAYTNWLDSNPNDTVARKERSDMFAEIFQSDSAIAPTLSKLLHQIDKKPAIEQVLVSRAE